MKLYCIEKSGMIIDLIYFTENLLTRLDRQQ